MQRDFVAILVALVAHAAIAYGLMHVPARPPAGPKVVEIEVRKPAPAPQPLTPPAKPEPPQPPPRKVVMKVRPIVAPPVATPPPNAAPPKDPPKDPPKPVFGVTMSSTTDSDSSMVVPVGNTTMIDPSKSAKNTGPVVPLPAAPQKAPPKPEYKPVSELYVKQMPDIDSEACGKMAHYTSEAEQLGIEGEVKLRVALDERGAVHDIKILAGLGHGLDEEAMQALRHRCKFKPAIGTDGKPVAFVISSYTFHFEVPR